MIVVWLYVCVAQASSGLSEQEIKNMVQDAEVHADEDKCKKERIEAHNHLDSLIYSSEKSLNEYGASLEASTKTHIEEAKAKKSLDSADVTELKRTADELTQASHKLAEAVYTQ